MEIGKLGNKIEDVFLGGKNQRTQEEAEETNPYFFYKRGHINEKLMIPGPRTLKLFKVVNVNLVPSILADGVMPYNTLEQEGKKPDLTHTQKGEGDASFWTLGKVNYFYGGKEGKVLLELDNQNILNKDSVQYRKTDPRQVWSGKSQCFNAKELSLDTLPQNYWSDWWRSYEVLIPFVISPDMFKIVPLDISAKHFLDRNSISYEKDPVRHPITEHWRACTCGSEEGPMGYHKDDGWCG